VVTVKLELLPRPCSLLGRGRRLSRSPVII